MSRRSFLVALALVVLLIGGAGVVLFLLVVYEPDVYAKATAPSPAVRHQRSDEFLTEFGYLWHGPEPSDQNWGVQFTDEQINSFLEEGFAKQPFARLPDHVSRPHVVFEPGKAHLAFRYGGAWSTIITIDLRIWLAREEPNAVALEVEGLHAGALPISGQWLQEEFAKAGRETKGAMEVSWYRLNGHPVALLRFQADQAHPSLMLQDVHVDQGSLTIRGHSPEGAVHAFLMRFPDGVLKPVAD